MHFRICAGGRDIVSMFFNLYSVQATVIILYCPFFLWTGGGQPGVLFYHGLLLLLFYFFYKLAADF